MTLKTTPETNPEPNVQQAVPFFMVTNMEASLRFYVDGLGYKRTKQWIVDGKIRWCWLELEGASHMLQEYNPGKVPANKRGEGVPSASNAETPSRSTTTQ